MKAFFEYVGYTLLFVAVTSILFLGAIALEVGAERVIGVWVK